jgi:hypothetical protein
MSFRARHPGMCQCGCERLFDRDTEVQYTEDRQIVIVGHDTDTEVISVRTKVCTKCYLMHAGECF